MGRGSDCIRDNDDVPTRQPLSTNLRATTRTKISIATAVSSSGVPSHFMSSPRLDPGSVHYPPELKERFSCTSPEKNPLTAKRESVSLPRT